MHSIVCVKTILDPLGVAQLAQKSELRVDPASNRLAEGQGVTQVISPFDEQAVEAALRIQDKLSGKVTVLTLGPKSSTPTVKHALAMGANQGVIVQASPENHNAYSTAHILAAAVKKLGEFDFVFCGRQAADTDDGQVGPILGEALGVPCITFARNVEVGEGKARVTRVRLDGHEVIEAPLPVVVTVSNELGNPRYPSLSGIMGASRKEIKLWSLTDIGVTQSEGRVKVKKLYVPQREGMCEIIPGETPEDAAKNLALKLRQQGLI